MARIYWEPAVIDAGSATATTGEGPLQIGGSPARESRTVTLAGFGLPGGSISRFVDPGVELIGGELLLTPAIRVADRFHLDLSAVDDDANAPDWLVELTARDRATGDPTVYRLATRGGWTDDADASVATRRYRVETAQVEADRLRLSVAGDEAAMERLASDAVLLGLGYGLAFRESGPDANGRAYAAHSVAFEPSNTFRVDVIFSHYSVDGGAKVLAIKGASLGNPQFALFIGSGQDLRFRMQNSGGTAVTVVKFAPLIEVDKIYHATGVWDGSSLRVALNGVFGTTGIPTFTAAASGLTDDLHLGVAPGQPATLLDGEIYYAAVYADPPIDLAAISQEAFGFSTSDAGLVAEWYLDEGSGLRSDNRLDPDVHFLTLANPDPWDPWVYSKTGAIPDAGALWPVPLGFAQTRGIWGSQSEGLKTRNILHTCLPSLQFDSTAAIAPEWYQQLRGLDRVMAGGEALRIRVPAQTTPIKWGADGVGGWVENDFNPTAPPFSSPAYPFSAPIPGQQIRIGLTGAIDGDYTVRSVTRGGKNLYGRRIYLEAPGIATTGNGLASFETLGAYDVEATFDGMLEFQARPQTPVLVSGWWSAPCGATSDAIPGAVTALIQNRAGSTVAPDLAAQLAPWDEIAIGADWTGLTVREALMSAIGIMGVGASFSTTPAGVEVSRLVAPTGGEATAAVFTDENTREIEVAREVGAVGGFGCIYRDRGDVYGEGDLTPLALSTLSTSDLRWLTEAERLATSGQTPGLSERGGLSEDLVVSRSIVIDAAEARTAANYDLGLFNDGYYVVKVKIGIAGLELPIRRAKVEVTSDVHPALQGGVAGRVIGIGNEGTSAVLYVWIRKEAP